MKILLIYPPHIEPSQPGLGVASIAGAIKAAGHDVKIMDVNLKSFQWLLSRENLQETVNIVKEKFFSMNKKECLQGKEMFHYELMAHAMLSSEYCLNNLDRILEVAKGGYKNSSMEEFLWALRSIDNALRIVSARMYPTVVSFYTMHSPYNHYNHQEIMGASEDKCTIYYNYFKEKIVPEILLEKPDVVGFSVIVNNQIIPAITLLKLVKQAKPDIKCVVGGYNFSNLGRILTNYPKFFEFIDYQILYEGETAFTELLKAIENGSDVSSIPNLIYKTNDGKVKISDKAHTEDLNSLPCPEYEGINFEEYYNLKPVIPLAPTRGCYWGRCEFCEANHGTGGRFHNQYMERPINLIIQDMEYLQEKYKSNLFFFCVYVMGPRILRALSEAIIAKNMEVYWQCDVRLEKAFTPELCELMFKAGCRNVAIGLESGCDRVLKAMDKGVTVEIAEEALKNLHSAGIATHVMCFTGYPTETKEEGQMTIDFLMRNKQYIDTVGFSSFILMKTSPVYRRREELGLKEVNIEDDLPLVQFAAYTSNSGRQPVDILYETSELRKQILDEFSNFENSNNFGLGMSSISLAFLSENTCCKESTTQKEEASDIELNYTDDDKFLVRANIIDVQFPLAQIKQYHTIFEDERRKNMFQYGMAGKRYEEQILSNFGPIEPKPQTYIYVGDTNKVYNIKLIDQIILEEIRKGVTVKQLCHYFGNSEVIKNKLNGYLKENIISKRGNI